MLDKELWKKLPMTQTIPDLAAALQGSRTAFLGKAASTGSLPAAGDTQNGDAGSATSDAFDVWMAQGNPWRSTQGMSSSRSLCSTSKAV